MSRDPREADDDSAKCYLEALMWMRIFRDLERAIAEAVQSLRGDNG